MEWNGASSGKIGTLEAPHTICRTYFYDIKRSMPLSGFIISRFFRKKNEERFITIYYIDELDSSIIEFNEIINAVKKATPQHNFSKNREALFPDIV